MCNDDDELELRSRDFDWVGYVEGRLRELAEARHETNPRTQQSPANKTWKASHALQNASNIVEKEAGWALDHVHGLSLAGQKILPSQPGGSKNHPDYLEYREFADVHDHELNGSRALNKKPLSPELRRLFLRNLVYAQACPFPSWLREELLEALDALDAGATAPLLTPATRVGTPFFKARARLRLVAFTRFRQHAYALTLKEARKFVGGQIGRSHDAIKSWEDDLETSCLGDLEVKRQLQLAENAAGRVRHAALRKMTGEVTEQELSSASYHEHRWGQQALDKAIAEWRVAEGYVN